MYGADGMGCCWLGWCRFLRRVLYGWRNVWVMLRAGILFGLDDGVCTAQHLMKIPIKTTKATPISSTAHQYSCAKEEPIVTGQTFFSIAKLCPYCNPLSDGQQRFTVEQQVLESGQRTFSINSSALEEHVAIAL